MKYRNLVESSIPAIPTTFRKANPVTFNAT
jgi:hypothetical protein